MQQTPDDSSFIESLIDVVVWFAALAGGIIAIAAFIGLLWRIGRFIDRRFRPFGGAYKTLKELDLGVQSAYLRAKFGQPAVGSQITGPIDNTTDPISEVSYQCDIYRGIGHIVGTLSDESGSVSAIAIASTSDHFHGTLSLTIGRVILNKTTMVQVTAPSRVHYSVGGSGGFNYYVLDVLDGQHNAGRYRDHLWGQIYGPDVRADIRQISGSPIGGYEGDYSPSLDSYRNRWIINVVFISNLPLDKGELGYFFIHAIENEARRTPLVGGTEKRRWRRA